MGFENRAFRHGRACPGHPRGAANSTREGGSSERRARLWARSGTGRRGCDYQVRVREKDRKEREERISGADRTKYDLKLGNGNFLSETKGRAILRTFRYLVDCGFPPLSRISWRRQRFVMASEAKPSSRAVMLKL